MTLDMTILYVNDPAASAAFYARILGQEPTDLSPGFALFVLPTGLKLGLWRADAVTPPARGVAAGSELVIHVSGDSEVEERHAAFAGAGIAVLEEPVRREFGYSFVVADPDGHRIRVMKAEG